MSLGSGVVLLAAYYGVLALLSLYGIHRLVMISRLARARGRNDPSSAPREAALHARPRVTVQLPIYNELNVAPRLVEAASRLRYPRELLEIQILDDSDDETSLVLERQTADLVSRGHDVRHIRRTERTGFKAGALDAGLAQAHGELIAIFDADFVPEEDFLERIVPEFDDPGIGMVQARWDHLNREHSLLTRLQAILLDGHFLIEHAARHLRGRFFNFNGTAGVWRREAIVSAGGWQHDTLTEDLDLSYRAQLAGWRFRFLSKLDVPAELPENLAAFRSQQRRWTLGSVQTLRKLGRQILTAEFPLGTRVEAVAHLSSNLAYPLMVLLTLLLPATALLPIEGIKHIVMPLDAVILTTAWLSVLSFYMVSQKLAGQSLRRAAVLQIPVMALGIGMALHNSRAVLRGLVQRGGEFVRTPKSGQVHPIPSTHSSSKTASKTSATSAAKHAGTDGSHDYDAPRTPSWWAEAVIATYLATGLGLAIAFEQYWKVPFLMIFLLGYSMVIVMALGSRRSQAIRRSIVAPLSFERRRAA